MNQPKTVLVVGGGSSGWMTAALLSQRLPEVEVSLIEASDIPTIGVGESTNRTMRYFQQAIGLDERSFMRASNAAFKIGIRFANFDKLGGAFFHPFGLPANTRELLFQPDAQTRYPTFRVAEARTMFSRSCPYAYQLDAGLYGEYLKQELKRRGGVRHIVDRVRRVDLDERGQIRGIESESRGTLTADLYIDCSGFSSMLLGKALGEPFSSYSHYLLNDRAVAARIPYLDKSSELVTYTNCTALSAGWVWNIPLWSRIGTGYVYSSGFLSQHEAEAELRAHLGEERVKDLTFNHITIRTGRHERAWVANCVGIGISYGFLEPLESTGLSLTQASIMDLASALEARAPLHVERDMYNRRQREVFDSTRDFIVAHYVLTSRRDTSYWKHVHHDNPLPESLLHVLGDARVGSFRPLENQPQKQYQVLNWNAILSGMGFFGKASGSADTPDLAGYQNHARLLAETVFGDEIPGDGMAGDLSSRPPSDLQPQWYPTW